jgi:TRAP transporter 4TM/12TM fusion protein
MSEATADKPQQVFVDPENPAAHLTLPGRSGQAVWLIALIFCAWQIYTSAYSPVPTIVVRSLHVGFLLLMVFALFRWRGGHDGTRAATPWYDWVLGFTALGLAFYHWYFEAELIQRAGDPSTTDLWVGIITIALLFEAARRVMGWALPVMCIVFIPYALWGRYLPEPFTHRGFDIFQVIDQIAFGTEGIYGTPTFVSATYIFLFILFGSFLEKAGMIGLFNDVALGLVGGARGGPAKVAVISSGLMGTINGSGVANVLTTGQFTIPLMMRFGYSGRFAGAVEATAAMGGQIMPPVMGAVAFIMAETIGVPYAEIAKAAIIPALLYYASAMWMVHLEAGKQGLIGLPKNQLPSPMAAIRKNWHLALPLAVLVFLLFDGFTPLFAGTVGLGLTAILIMGSAAVGKIPAMGARFVFWILLGVLFAGLVGTDTVQLVTGLAILIGLLVIGLLFTRGGKVTLRLLLDSMVDGAKSALGVGVACALVGILIGAMTLTGLASELARIILDLAEGRLWVALLLTMVVCLILGTGLPTIPNYIITAAMAAPVLLQMGVPLIVSHMFTFYFGIMADLTPPVALAALAASSIAKAGHMEIGFTATRIGIAGYVVPFMAVYSPELMLQGDNVTVLSVAYILFKALLGIGFWGGAATGYLFGLLNWPERIIAVAIAVLLVTAASITDEFGLVCAAAFLGYHLWRQRQSA